MRGDIDMEARTAPRAGTGTPPMNDARRVLDTVFGFEAFRPGQEAVIEALLGGRGVLTVMPAGSGKSLCFQVPALAMGGLTVVVSPLVALMQDQVAALKLAGVAADGIHSGNTREDNAGAWRRAAAGATRLLYMAPERLMTERVLTALGRLPLRLFAIDEAHCISQSLRPADCGGVDGQDLRVGRIHATPKPWDQEESPCVDGQLARRE